MSSAAGIGETTGLVVAHEVEALRPPHDPRPALEDAIADSVARTAFLGLDERITTFTPGQIESGNDAVRKRFGGRARRAILLPDGVIFAGMDPEVVYGYRARELLGYFILARSLEPTATYHEMGFFHGAGTIASMQRTAVQARNTLTTIVDASGNPLVHTEGSRNNFKSGIEDVMFLDARHGEIYKTARRTHSAELWRNHVLEGAPEPELSEDEVMMGARDTVRKVNSNSLDCEQTERLRRLNPKVNRWLEEQEQPKTAVVNLGDPGLSDPEINAIRKRLSDNLDPPWQNQAACKDPYVRQLFFPTVNSENRHDKKFREQRAKAVCANCPLKVKCLKTALKNREPEGVWGETTPEERKVLLRQRAKRR